jgi:sulfotransferase family protein
MPVTVLYVGGIGRSGSTMLDRMLGQLPGFASVGELVFLWERGLGANERCGCGARFRDCPFWSAVGERAFGGWHRVDLARVLERKSRVDRNRFVPALMAGGLSPGFDVRRRAHAELLVRLYRAIADESGAAVVVDSSKHVSTAALLRTAPGVDLRIVRLIRDPRGVAFSWAKHVDRPDAAGASEMARIGPARAAARWLTYNAMMEVVRLGRPSALIRYETLVGDPEPVLRSLAALAGRPIETPLEFLDHARVRLEPAHTVAGNPLRFRSGWLDLRLDDAWTRDMGRRDRRVVTGLTFPALAALGYVRGGR